MTTNVKPFKNALLNTFFLSLAAYSSPNFGIFVIYFYLEFSKKFFFSKKIIIISLLNLILSLPFFIYLFYLDVNFIFDNKFFNLSYNAFSLENISNKIIIIISIFLFYLFPLIITNLYKIKFELSKLSLKFILTSLIFFFIVYLFDFSSSYEITNSGGGFFYNLSNLLFQNNILLFILSFFTYLYLLEIFRLNALNLILFLCLILSHPQMTIWQANFSPTILFLLLLLFKGVINKNNLNLKTLIISYSYFFIYLISNIVMRNILI